MRGDKEVGSSASGGCLWPRRVFKKLSRLSTWSAAWFNHCLVSSGPKLVDSDRKQVEGKSSTHYGAVNERNKQAILYFRKLGKWVELVRVSDTERKNFNWCSTWLRANLGWRFALCFVLQLSMDFKLLWSFSLKGISSLLSKMSSCNTIGKSVFGF